MFYLTVIGTGVNDVIYRSRLGMFYLTVIGTWVNYVREV